MGYRGILLVLDELNRDSAFHVVSPNATLQLPMEAGGKGDAGGTGDGTRIASAGLSSSFPPLSLARSCAEKMLVVDFVTSKLLQVTQQANVKLQPSTRSILWIKMEHDASVSLHPHAENADNQQQQESRLCYCFHFRSPVEYDLFAAANKAQSRLNTYTMLEKSVRMEMEISREIQRAIQQKEVEEAEFAAAAAAMKKKPLLTLERVRRRQSNKQQQVEVSSSASSATLKVDRKLAVPPKHRRHPEEPVVASSVAIAVSTGPEMCVLCSSTRSNSELVVHPFVLQNGRGQKVLICKKRCLKKLMRQRLRHSPSSPTEQDLSCGLCGLYNGPDRADTRGCTHPQCNRIYCKPCMTRLLIPLDLHSSSWLCPNCTTFRDQSTHPRGNAQSAVVSVRDETGACKLPPINKNMSVEQYLATYVEFLVTREETRSLDESEDVCFCCKDGGEVVECDWKCGDARCPKVYHQDCLGFVVPDNQDVWFCPRHLCQVCGSSASFSCRFCVASFCKEHLSSKLQQIGSGSPDIAPTKYVVCTTCDEQLQTAISDGHVSEELAKRALNAKKIKRIAPKRADGARTKRHKQ